MNDKDQKQNSVQTEPSVDIHDRVAEAYYGLMGPQFMRDTQARIHWICRQIEGKSILDVGCSQGIVPILLAREGLHVIGLDSSPKAIDEANHYLANEPEQVRRHVSFVNADFLSWDVEGAKIDTVVMSEVLEHLTRPECFLETAARILPKKGRLIVTVPFGINDFIDHKHTFYLLEPLRLISKHFDVAEIEILGKWLGIVADRRTAANSRTEPFQPTIALMEKLEGAFCQTERVLRDELTVIRKKLEEANQKYRGATEQVSTLKQRVMEEERARQVAEQGQHQAAGQLEQTKCYLQEEQAALQQQVAQLSQQEHAHSAAADEAAKNLLRLKTELETMRGKLEEANQKYRGATEQNSALKQQVVQEEAAHGRLEEANQKYRGAIEQVTALKQRVTEEERARQAGEQAQAQATTKLKAELEAARGRLEEANQKYRGATEQVATLKQQVSRDEAMQQGAEQARAQASAQLAEVQRSFQEERKALQQQLAQLSEEGQAKTVTVHEGEKKLIRLETELEARSRLEEANQKYQTATEQTTALKQRVTEEEAARQVAEQKLQETARQLEQSQVRLQEERTALQQQVAQSTAEVQAKMIVAHEAEQQVVRLEGELGTVRGRLEEANQKYRGSTEQVSTLKLRVTEEEAARKTAEQALAQATIQLEQTAGQLEQSQVRLQEERTVLQQQIVQLVEQGQAQSVTVHEAEQQVVRLEAELLAVRTRLEEVNQKYRGATEQLSALEGRLRQQLAQRESDLKQIKQRPSSAEIDTRASIEQVTELEKTNERLLNSVKKLERAQQVKTARMQAMERRANAAVQQADKVRSTLSFQLGHALIHGFKSWNGLRTLPSTLWSIKREAIRKRNNPSPKPESRQAETIMSPVKPLNESATEDLCLPSGTPKRQPLEKLLKDLRNLPVACVVDEFTYHSFKHECDFHQIRSATWEQDLEKLQPKIMFIESAWRGIESSWTKKVSNPSAEIMGVIDWCIKNSVPTLLWCKEDPQHFNRFLHIARVVDYIFTTDIDCIANYKQEVGHDRVYLLPFAAQPAIHNPIEIYQRKDAFNFAGSYYWRYPERQRDFKTIIDMAKSFRPVEIYDRNFNKALPHDFVFPEEYSASILGDLPFDQIDKAYKGYRYGINMNTIKQSQTMFARRVFELLASNTVVISNFSRGVRVFFGNLVICSDSPTEHRRQLDSVCGDEIRYRKYRLAGLRKVMSEHTYAHRMAYIVTKLTGIHTSVHRPRVFMLGIPGSLDEAKHMVVTFERQNYQNRTLCLVGSRYSEFKAPYICCVSSVGEVQSLCAKGSFIAPVSADDYYGPNYLTDLVLATVYSDVPVIGKGSYFECLSDTIAPAHAGQQYHYVNQLPARASLISPQLFAGLGIQTAIDLAECVVNHQRSLSIDEFNYCRGSSMTPGEDVLRLVNDESGLDAGLSWEETISPAAERIHAVTDVSIINDEGKLPGLDPAMWFALLPKKIPTELKFKAEGNEINIRSTLLSEKHVYVYLTKEFTRAELNFVSNNCFKMTGISNIDVRTVFVFLDEHGQKIGHAMNNVGTSHSLSIPSNCRNLRLGLRVQGAGSASLGRLVFGDLRKRPSVLLSKSQYLLLSKHYPAYDDLYRYGFVHSRVRAYRQQGLNIDLFKLSEQANTGYREFEQVDVLTSDHVFLDTVLRQGMHTHVLVHYLDKNIWEVLSRYLDRVNVIVWVHGAEIQPWYRRAIKFDNDVERHKAQEVADQRRTMWLEMLERPHPNLRLVFPSRYLAQQAMADLGIELLEAQHKVIPNFIDGNQFVYHRKPVEHRLRVLSIRPFASAIYANDMTVKAIGILSEEPFFNQLHFRIVGDGPLFEETVKPLQGMHNVVLDRRFLSHAEISALHQEYGIFLVPSRMDSQGVSRDEAMASGLVPITNRVAAIPEFVDESCAFLADPEDAEGLADGIRRLYHDPALFLRMSQAAAEHVRNKCGYKDTIERELGLLSSTYQPAEPKCQIAPKCRASYKVAIYGDVNLNITDGSAIWAASLAETLAGLKDVHVTLYLKARIHSTHIIAPLLNLSANLRLVEPNLEHGKILSPNQALERIKADDAITGYDGIILRGLDLCTTAACSKELRGRIWPYITDMPESSEHITTEIAERIKRIIDAAAYILCQTRQFEAHLVSNFPTVEGKTRLLPPMIPKIVVSRSRTSGQEEPLRIVYAGKFAPLWGIREMFEAFDELRVAHPDAELHIYGDKIHNPSDDPGFQNEIRQRLDSGRGIVWHRAVERETLMRDLQKYNIGWAYRHAQLEANTHELSTKVLEYAACGLPVILARNGINEDVFGAEYPLYADSAKSASALLRRIADDSDLYAKAVARVTEVSRDFSFESVRERLLRQQLFQANLQPKHSGLNYAA